MLIIGEKINSSIKEVEEAIHQRNEAFIRDLARRQKEAGAHYLEVNSGLRVQVEEETEDLKWLVPIVQGETGLPLCLDSPHPQVLKAALQLHQGVPIINSINGDMARWEEILPLVKNYNGAVIALPADRQGIPSRIPGRLRIAERIIQGVLKAGIPAENLYFDPIVMPLSAHTANGLLFIDTLKEIKRFFPETKTVSGLSNVSFGLPRRSLINQAFLILSFKAGLDAAIMNPLDKGLMAILRATEALLNRDPYCMAYIKAFREGRLG